jgi:hypothetical protein
MFKAGEKLAYEVVKTAQMKTQNSIVQAKNADQNIAPGAGAKSSTIIMSAMHQMFPHISMIQFQAITMTQMQGFIMMHVPSIFITQIQQFLYWDTEKQQCLPALVSSEDSSTSREEGKKAKEKDGQDKVKVAKNIAKDMERWAETLNQKKDSTCQNLVAGYAVLERKE